MGSAKKENDTILSMCHCNKGWTQPPEMNFFVDRKSLHTSICLHNKFLLKLSIAYALQYNSHRILPFIIVKTWKQHRSRARMLIDSVVISIILKLYLDLTFYFHLLLRC
mmetsp:Transcript_39/g.35  ORF Transcript_39/g.35 Transcript_39/m.35 type:complete len:109 (+) Transcript_39:217-543(+)